MSIQDPYSVGKVRKILLFETIFHDSASDCTKLRLESDHLPDYVFVNVWEGERGHPMTYDAVMSLIRRLRKRTAIEVAPHQFRHTRATSWLRDDQLSLESTSALLGHASIETTRATYDHRNMDDVKRELQAARKRRESEHEQ